MTFDEKDQAILDAILLTRAKNKSVLCGDYVLFPTGELERISNDLSNSGVQTSPGGSFYLRSSGNGSFSGGLNPATPRAALQLTDAMLPGNFWFFHHGQSGAHRGVYFDIPCRVYRTTAAYEGFLRGDFVDPRMKELKEQLAVLLHDQVSAIDA